MFQTTNQYVYIYISYIYIIYISYIYICAYQIDHFTCICSCERKWDIDGIGPTIYNIWVCLETRYTGILQKRLPGIYICIYMYIFIYDKQCMKWGTLFQTNPLWLKFQAKCLLHVSPSKLFGQPHIHLKMWIAHLLLAVGCAITLPL